VSDRVVFDHRGEYSENRMTATWEREIKLAFDSADVARGAVARLGAELLKPRRLQVDTLFDTPTGSLVSRGSVLRVRRDGEHQFITFKNPAEHPTVKLREEIETSVGSADTVSALFEQLGYVPSFRYEKYREEFRHGGAVIAIDETPVGTFVEIEGTDEGIEAIAGALGRSPADYVTESYRALFLRYRAAHGLTTPDMVFAPAPQLP
jgi:adenylate cyclase class 2